MTRLTPETIRKTRQWFADNAKACAELAQPYGSGPIRKEGGFYVNDIETYRAEQLAASAEFLAGKWDHTLTFAQRAHYIQTGESVPLMR